jgi:hypothetical protein
MEFKISTGNLKQDAWRKLLVQLIVLLLLIRLEIGNRDSSSEGFLLILKKYLDSQCMLVTPSITLATMSVTVD